MGTKFVVFDVETTGVDVFNDRIVQLFIGLADEEGNLVSQKEWIIDPGIEVPEGAANVHGLTTEYLQENGQDAKEALTEARHFLDIELFDSVTWVAFNANFDISILDAEFKRYGIDNSWGNDLYEKAQIIDPIVIDRYKDKYRKGKRTLEALSHHYGIPFDADKAHDASYDVEVTAKVAVAVLAKYGYATNKQQSQWYREWAIGLEKYFRRTDPNAKVNKNWPIRSEEKEESND